MSWGPLPRLGAMAAVGLALVGCDSIGGNQEEIYAWNEERDLARDNAGTKAIIDQYFAAKPEDRADIRDKAITWRMNAINANYREFTIELREARAGTGLAADVGITLLAFLTAITGGAQTKSALGAGTAAIAGGKGAFDRNVFYEKALAAIVAQMDAQRARITLDIRKGMRMSALEYPLIAALDDLGRLERAGSVESAIAGLTEAAKTAARVEESKVNEIQIARSPELSLYLLSAEGRKRVADFAVLVGRLTAERAIRLATVDLPVKNPEADAAINQEYPADFNAVPAADRGNMAKDMINRRYNRAQSLDEMAKWEKAVKAP